MYKSMTFDKMCPHWAGYHHNKDPKRSDYSEGSLVPLRQRPSLGPLPREPLTSVLPVTLPALEFRITRPIQQTMPSSVDRHSGLCWGGAGQASTPCHGGGPGSVHRGEAATQMAILGAGKNPVVRLESLEAEVVGGTVHFGSVGGAGGWGRQVTWGLGVWNIHKTP